VSFTGNANFLNNAAVAIAQSINKEWSMVWTSSHPLITVIQHKKTNFNQGFTIKGLKMVLAVMGDDQTNPASGVATGSAEAVAMGENLTNGLSQFEFNFGHIRANYMLLESDVKLLQNGAYGNILTAKKQQMLGSVMNLISNWLSSTTADQADNSRFLGMYQPLEVQPGEKQRSKGRPSPSFRIRDEQRLRQVPISDRALASLREPGIRSEVRLG
jgi:hypothetical protein